MPSWNVHIAHAEQLLSKHSPSELGISDVDAFMLGCLLPDIYVGYMVQPLTKKIPYRETHLADASRVPLPDYEAFAHSYHLLAPSDEKDASVSATSSTDPAATAVTPATAATSAPSAAEHLAHDLILGTWCHLMADHIYNAHTRIYLKEHHIPRGEAARIGKQGDLALFGRTFYLHTHIAITPSLLRQTHAFPAYEINDEDLYTTSKIVDNIVEETTRAHIDAVPHYTMLEQAFFDEAFAELAALMERNLLLSFQAHKS